MNMFTYGMHINIFKNLNLIVLNLRSTNSGNFNLKNVWLEIINIILILILVFIWPKAF